MTRFCGSLDQEGGINNSFVTAEQKCLFKVLDGNRLGQCPSDIDAILNSKPCY